MTLRRRIKVLGTTMSLGGAALAAMLIRSPPLQAHDDWDGDEGPLIKIGFEIAPVPLKLEGKNRDLVGLGSFIVNAPGECSDFQISRPETPRFSAGKCCVFLALRSTVSLPVKWS
jgi:hypothetical protein